MVFSEGKTVLGQEIWKLNGQSRNLLREEAAGEKKEILTKDVDTPVIEHNAGH